MKIESEFFKHVDLNQASRKLGLEMDVVDLLFRFWILKRRSQANRPLFIPRMTDDTEAGLSVSFYRTRTNKGRSRLVATPLRNHPLRQLLCAFYVIT